MAGAHHRPPATSSCSPRPMAPRPATRLGCPGVRGRWTVDGNPGDVGQLGQRDDRLLCEAHQPKRAAADCQSDDGWVALGASDTGTTTTLYNSTNAVRVGTQGSAGTASMLDGTLYYAQAATAIDGTPDVAFWPKDAETDSAATSWVSSVSGETWTGTGSAYDLKVQGPVLGRQLTPGTPVRVTATRTATDYDVWTGYLRRSPRLACVRAGRYGPVAGDGRARLAPEHRGAVSTHQGVHAGSGVGSLWPTP